MIFPNCSEKNSLLCNESKEIIEGNAKCRKKEKCLHETFPNEDKMARVEKLWSPRCFFAFSSKFS